MPASTRDYDLTNRPDADLVREASFWENAMYGPDDPQGRPAAEYSWREVDYSIALIKSAPDSWKEWMDAEIAMWVADGDPHRFDSLFERPIEEAVVLVEIDGFGYLWDGYHRTAASEVKGEGTIKAIVGIPAPEYALTASPAP